jgi:hypothetical protein
MLSEEKVREIEQLLLEGKLSQRRIAKMTGASRGSVNAIATGTRKLQGPKPVDDRPVPSGPFVRCPVCGANTQMPCMTCFVRDERRMSPEYWISDARVSPSIGLGLKPHHKERYQEVLEWRRMHQGTPWPSEEWSLEQENAHDRRRETNPWNEGTDAWQREDGQGVVSGDTSIIQSVECEETICTSDFIDKEEIDEHSQEAKNESVEVSAI